MPGPAPTPTKLKALRGNPGQRRLNQYEPQPTETTDAPPPDLTDPGALAVWRALAPEAVRIGTLTVIDRGEFALACLIRAKSEQFLRRSGDEPNNDFYAGLKAARISSSMFARFGIGASDRSKITVTPPKKAASRWSGLLKA